MQMSYEKLRLYQQALQFLAFAAGACERLPRGNGPIADQLKRASASVCLNTAEACGKIRDADRKRHFAMARGSAMECGAILDVLNELKILPLQQYRRDQKAQLYGIVAMLSALARTSQFEQEQEQEQEHDLGDETEKEHDSADDKDEAGRAPVVPLGR